MKNNCINKAALLGLYKINKIFTLSQKVLWNIIRSNMILVNKKKRKVKLINKNHKIVVNSKKNLMLKREFINLNSSKNNVNNN
jgi:hypothetical protein